MATTAQLDERLTALELRMNSRVADFERLIDGFKAENSALRQRVAELEKRPVAAVAPASIAPAPAPVTPTPIDTTTLAATVKAAVAVAVESLPATVNQYPDKDGKPVRFLIKP